MTKILHMSPLAQSRNPEPLPLACQDCEGRTRGVCGAMSNSQLREINRYTVQKELRAGTEIHGQGTEVVSYANLIRGVVKLTKVMEDGRLQIVGLQFAPDFVGRPFAKDSAVTAEAATSLKICAVPKSLLDRLAASNSAVERRLLGQVLTELDEAREWMLTLGRKTAREKVASFLYLLVSHAGDDTERQMELEIPLTRQEIADFLGLTIETVSRQMTALRRDKIIEVFDNRRLVVKTATKLAAVARIDLP